MSDIVNLIKIAALDAVKESAPADIMVGTVISSNPLRVDINQKFPLEEIHLLKTTAVADRSVEMSFSVPTSIDNGHSHNVTGTVAFKVHNKLREQERVLILRVPGGQKYVILDRVVD